MGVFRLKTSSMFADAAAIEPVLIIAISVISNRLQFANYSTTAGILKKFKDIFL